MSLEPNRPLTDEEHQLARWMLLHGGPEASPFLSQIDQAVVTPWRCECGCASINFQIKGQPPAPPGVHILGEFVFGDGDELSGIFIFESEELLSGIEVYGLAGDAPKRLPSPAVLRTWSASSK